MKMAGYEEIVIPVGQALLKGDLFVPENAHALVIFSHGSGSSRKSTRNRMVAERLHGDGIGTLLFDLLTEEEDQYYPNRFNIDLLTSRLIAVTRWIESRYRTEDYPIGYFGASTGAASALKAAAVLTEIKAVVSRGGRPDMAHGDLGKVSSPVLLIIGELDHNVLELNRYAYDQLRCAKKTIIIHGATHLFEEPGTLEQAAEAACAWFGKYLLPAKITKEDV